MRARHLGLCLLLAAASSSAQEPKPGDPAPRRGDEMIVCGRLIHTTTPIVTWLDPGGYDAYRVDRRVVVAEESAAEKAKAKAEPSGLPATRFGLRKAGLSAEQVEKAQAEGWDLPLLQQAVDQFVLHFDACGTSRKCFEVLQDERGLSVHFMLDLDGTIYQTLDLKEAAWHATKANGRSIGIEIANIGTFRPDAAGSPKVARWYQPDAGGKTRITLPDPTALPAASRSMVLRPDRDRPVVGRVQGEELAQYDLTPQQYESLIKLTAALCRTFPKIRCDYPRTPEGAVAPAKLADDLYSGYAGILGHYHVQSNKVDPGPAFQWDRLVDGARALMAR
ncbi:N-acetylmuramoyl-L-alanine amidase [Tundrisphaera sp. TA3]|uniref:N-acetylmuramoyl-L-alanine amidase n=1 Tax=Tundrisphaera sp. TA3 TaxID=3435775 RepID=UPI003EBB0A5C